MVENSIIFSESLANDVIVFQARNKNQKARRGKKNLFRTICPASIYSYFHSRPKSKILNTFLLSCTPSTNAHVLRELQLVHVSIKHEEKPLFLQRYWYVQYGIH